MNRREFLSAAIAAAVAARCQKTAKPLPPGTFVGASVERGHQLRDGAKTQPTRWRNQDVVIVGGGVAGLAAAWRLKKQGVSAEVLELEPDVGGTARGGRTELTPHPWGAHYVNVPMTHNTDMIALLNEAGVMDNGEVAEQFRCREPEERVFYKGRWYEGLYLRAGASKDDLAELDRFEGLMNDFANKRPRSFVIPTSRGTHADKALDQQSMQDWLKPFKSERLRWLVDYACRDDYGAHPRDISAWAGVFYFTARLDNKETQDVVTWPAGNGHLVDHLKKSATARTNALVTRIDANDVIGVDGEGAFGIHAKAIICATPQFITARLIDDPARAKAFRYSTWLVANLSVSERPKARGFPLAWDNVLYDSPSLGYVVATHQRGLDRGPTVLTYYLPLCEPDDRKKLLDTPRDVWAELILRDLEKAHPEIRDLTTHMDIMRWGHAMVRPVPGFIYGDALAKAREPKGKLHFAHSDLSGIPLFEEAFDRGLRAADAVTRVAL